MDQKDIHRNITLYRLLILFNEPLFWGPIIIISLQKLAHMSLPDIYLMESAAVALNVLLDAPAGALADLIGKKKTIIIGQVFLFASHIGFACMHSSLMAWGANISWAIGFSFQSGADKAFLYNNLNGNGTIHEFKRIEGKAVGGRYLLIACSSLVVGPIAEIGLRIPILMSIPGTLVPLIASCLFKESVMTEKYDGRKQFRILRDGILFSLRKPEIRWMIGFSALIMTAAKVWFFTYNPYFETVGLNLKLFGLIFFLLNLTAWLSSKYAYRIEMWLKEKTCVLWMILFTGVPIVLMGVFPYGPLAYLVVTQNFVRGFWTPFLGDFMNRHIESDHIRTTVLSVRSSSTNAANILALAGFGFVTGRFGLLASLIALGITVLVLGKFSFGRYKKLSA